MKAYFTICSNNYLAFAIVLGRTLKHHEPEAIFYIFLCDEKINGIDYADMAEEVIPVAAIEPAMDTLSLKYNIVELNTCVKPGIIEYLMQKKNVDKVIFLDPDIKVYHSLAYLDNELETANILLVPHIYTPIPLDKKTPAETDFLNFGIYNLGFIAIKKSDESLRFIAWWKERTYEQGYIDVYKGIFVDQLMINYVPVFFRGVKLLQDKGMNVAPWNLHERWLSLKTNQYMVNDDEPLKFYHFSRFVADVLELPVAMYNRFTLQQRQDLNKLYREYNQDLKLAGHLKFYKLPNVYTAKRNMQVSKLKQQKWIDRLLLKKFFISNKK